MEGLPPRVLSEGLKSDLLTRAAAVLISRRCELNSREHPPADGLKEGVNLRIC